MAALLFALPTTPLRRRLAAAGAVAGIVLVASAPAVAAQPGRVGPSGATALASRAFVCQVPGTGAGPAAPAQDRPATGLRVALGAKLGEHAYLLMEAMRAAAADSPDAQAIATTLDANTEAIASAIGSVYGGAAGQQFRAVWQRHIDAARAYGDATRTGDTTARQQATDALAAFRTDLDTFLQQANPKLDAHDEAHAVALHLQQLQSYADGDYAQAYRVARQAYAHMYDLGDTLARAVASQFPGRFPDIRVAFSPASELRVGLDRLLGEHLVLAAEAMRAAISDAPDTAAARQALDANADDLSAAVSSVYGDDAGSAFAEVWRAHLDAYLAYIDATSAGDAARADAARSTLGAYGRVFGDFMAKANPNLTSEGVSTLIGHHTQALLEMVDAYQAGDSARAYATVAEAYDHMFTVGDALAGAIAAQFPREFRDLAGPPNTDTTPAAHAHGDVPLMPILVSIAAVAALVATLAYLDGRLRRGPMAVPVGSRGAGRRR